MANIKIIKKEISNLKENLESIDSDDVELNKLHQRVYDLNDLNDENEQLKEEIELQKEIFNLQQASSALPQVE